METKPIRVLIADDLKLLRDVIRLYIERVDDIIVVDESPDLKDAVERVSLLRPDIIVMNDYLPPLDSAHATALFREQGFTTAILIISMHLEPDLIIRSFFSGANGFMHKDEIDQHLLDAIRRIDQGERYMSPKAQDVSRMQT